MGSRGRQNNISREHYHGGKFNGVNCIKIMSSEILFGEFQKIAIEMKDDNACIENINEIHQKY